MTVDVSRAARIVFACGASGSGKSHFVKHSLLDDRPPRLLIFDPEGEYEAFGYPTSDVRELLRAVQHPTFAVVWKPAFLVERAQAEFGLCCQLAFDVCSRAGRSVTLVVDELHQLTQPNRAPAWWRACVTRGRKHGLTVYAASQRAAEVDKTIVSNASILRTGRLGFPADCQTIAAAMSIDPAEVAALVNHQWIAADRLSGVITRGD